MAAIWPGCDGRGATTTQATLKGAVPVGPRPDVRPATTHLAPRWPVAVPRRPRPTVRACGKSSAHAIYGDLADLRALANDPGRDLTSLARHAAGNEAHTLLRQLLVVAQHNAYHIGEFAILRQVMGLWPETHES